MPWKVKVTGMLVWHGEREPNDAMIRQALTRMQGDGWGWIRVEVERPEPSAMGLVSDHHKDDDQGA